MPWIIITSPFRFHGRVTVGSEQSFPFDILVQWRRWNRPGQYTVTCVGSNGTQYERPAEPAALDTDVCTTVPYSNIECNSVGLAHLKLSVQHYPRVDRICDNFAERQTDRQTDRCKGIALPLVCICAWSNWHRFSKTLVNIEIGALGQWLPSAHNSFLNSTLRERDSLE